MRICVRSSFDSAPNPVGRRAAGLGTGWAARVSLGGPITDTTRSVWLKKMVGLRMAKKASVPVAAAPKKSASATPTKARVTRSTRPPEVPIPTPNLAGLSWSERRALQPELVTVEDSDEESPLAAAKELPPAARPRRESPRKAPARFPNRPSRSASCLLG